MSFDPQSEPSAAPLAPRTTATLTITLRELLQRGMVEREQFEVHLRRHRHPLQTSLRGAHGLVGCEHVQKRNNACMRMQASAGGRGMHAVYGRIDIW